MIDQMHGITSTNQSYPKCDKNKADKSYGRRAESKDEKKPHRDNKKWFNFHKSNTHDTWDCKVLKNENDNISPGNPKTMAVKELNPPPTNIELQILFNGKERVRH